MASAKGSDILWLVVAAGAGAMGWQMYQDSKKRKNPEDEMENHLTTRIQEKLASLESPTPQRASVDVDALERRLRKLEHSSHRRNPRDDYDDRDEYDDD